MRKIKLLFTALLSMLAWTGVMAQSGTGAQNDPFVVKTADDLNNLRNLLVPESMNYVVLENDVDMAGIKDWFPLFNNVNPYPQIDFDGKGHVISNLTSKTDGQYDYCGLFGVLCGNVRNLGVKNADVTCTGGTGIIAGYLGHSQYGQTCYVENVWVTGKLSASGYCGGMFGNIANESHITNCYANVEVTGESNITGGIIGRVREKVIMTNVYAAGSINQGGGIIGGGFKDETALGTYKNVAVWNNTEKNFGPAREGETLDGIINYDGTNFADMQKQVVAWDSKAWYCDMKEGSYPVLVSFLDPETKSNVQYEAALASITEGGVYRIKTDVKGTVYYVTLTGGLTSVKDNAGVFTLTKTEGGAFKPVGVRIDTGTERFTNPPLSNNVANLNPGSFSRSNNNDRADWERQVFFLNEEGKYAIRSCNTQPATSSWGDAGRTFWTYSIGEVATPCYTYDATYVWELDGPITSVNVTYKLYESDGTTQVGNAVTVKQESNSAANVPASMLNNYVYDYDVTGTIGNTDSEIKVVRTFKAGVAHALADLSNSKAYTIGCDRGAFLTKNDYLASTAHSSLTDADPSNFAVINYEDNYYLYSIPDKKFVTNNGSLSALLVNGTGDAIKLDAKTDPYFLGYFVINGTNNGLNTNGNDPYGYVINTWMNADPGNLYYMVEAGDFDATEALGALNDFFHPTYFITYVVKDAAGNEIFKSDAVPTRKGAVISSLPEVYRRPFCSYNDVNLIITEEQTTVEFTATWDGPFQLSTSDEDAKWYNMTIRSDYNVFVAEEEPYYPKTATTFQKADYEYQWAFAGNAYTGIKVFSRARGFGYTLTKDGDAAVMREGQYTWTIGKNADGFTLKETGTDYNCINQSGGASGPLKFWNSANSPTDNGSTFRISAVPTSFEWTIGDTGYATMYVPVPAFVDAPNAIPEPVGAWTFDNADDLLAGKGIATLQPAIEYPLLDTKKTITDVESLADANITAAEGYVAEDGAIFIPKGASLKMTHNLNTTELRTFTFMVDIKLADVTSYTSIFQTNVDNYNDGELFVNKGKVGVNYNGVGYAGEVVANNWHRVVFVVEDALPTVYLDGEQVAMATKADLRWAMDPIAYFFADEDGEETDVIASEICVWDKALTTSQVIALGTPGTKAPESTGVEAFAGIVQDDVLKLNKLNSLVPAKTPVVLKGAPGTYAFTIANDVVGFPLIENDLKGTAEEIEAAGNYVLAQPEGKPVGFYLAETGKIKAGKAYLEGNSNTGPLVKAFYFDSNRETAIENVNANVNVNKGAIYNLSGQRVSKAQNGIFIIDGKKVLK